MTRHKRALAVVVTGVVALGVAAAVRASIPDGSGVIYGCYTRSVTPGSVSGALRVIDPALRQSCTSSEGTVSWNQTGPQGPQGARGPTGPKGDPGANAYFAGTGLSLSGGNTFGISGSYQLPQGCTANQSPFLQNVFPSHPWGCFTAANAGEDCASGKFQTGVDANGDIKCATPPGSGGLPYAVDTGGLTGIPDDGTEYPIATVNVAAGTYLVVGKGVIGSGENVQIFRSVNCYLGGDSTELGSDTLDANNVIPFGALTDIVAVPAGGGDITMTCEADSGADGIVVDYSHLVAVRIG